MVFAGDPVMDPASVTAGIFVVNVRLGVCLYMSIVVSYTHLQTLYPDKMKDFYVKYFGAEANRNTMATDCPDPMYTLSFQGGFKIKLAPAGQSQSGFAARTLSLIHI